VTTSKSGSFRVGLEGSGGCGARDGGQAVLGLPVVVPVRGCGGSPVQGGAVGAVACDAVGALDRGGQPRTLRAAASRARTGTRRRMLSAGEREEISRGLAQGQAGVVIAARIGRHPSVVSREITRHGGRDRYRASRAGRVAAWARRRPKTRKLDADPGLRAQVLARLRAGYSPDQVAGRLRHEHPAEQACRVSHEAIYSWIYALPKGELARQGILLRSGRTHRRPRGRSHPPGARIVGMRSIDQRPAEVADRRVPGHWEGDRATWKVARGEWLCRLEARFDLMRA